MKTRLWRLLQRCHLWESAHQTLPYYTLFRHRTLLWSRWKTLQRHNKKSLSALTTNKSSYSPSTTNSHSPYTKNNPSTCWLMSIIRGIWNSPYANVTNLILSFHIRLIMMDSRRGSLHIRVFWMRIQSLSFLLRWRRLARCMWILRVMRSMIRWWRLGLSIVRRR